MFSGLVMGAIAAHMVGDYIVQNDWMAKNKMKRADALFLHVACYTACFFPVVLLHSANSCIATLSLAGLFIMHACTDCRRWANGDAWPCKPILVDQSIHAVQLWMLVEFITWASR